MLRRLLIVEDEAGARRQLKESLRGDQFLLRFEATGERALECAYDWSPDCILLDTTLPGTPGLEICRLLKNDARTKRVPVLLLGPSHDQTLVNQGFKNGADDFLVKPCHPSELLWRVRGLLRRYAGPAPRSEILQVGPLELDPEQGIAKADGRELPLTKTELSLLELFMRNPSRVLGRRFLLETIWGYDADVRTRVVDLTVFNLRKKLKRLGKYLTTRRSYGYSLKV